jgi:acyl-CoA synthetase (NDP forming)
MQPITRDPLNSSTDVIAEALLAGRNALDEHEAKALLSAYGVPVPAGGLTHSEAEAVSLAASIGGAVEIGRAHV